MTSRSGRLALAVLAVVALLGSDAAAQERRRPINVDVTISHISQRPARSERPARAERPSRSSGPEISDLTSSYAPPVPPRVKEIDERVRRLDATLRKQFRYDEIELVERHRMVLSMDEVGSVKLPNGRHFRARPVDVNERGVLMAVELDESVQMDVRAPNRHLVVIGAQPYKDGKLVISIEPAY